MKMYSYKMQWLLSLNGNFMTSQKQARKNVNKFIDAVGAKSFTVIYFRDKNLKVIDSYSNMAMFSTDKEANKVLKKLIKKLQPIGDAQYIEFIRK